MASSVRRLAQPITASAGTSSTPVTLVWYASQSATAASVHARPRPASSSSPSARRTKNTQSAEKNENRMSEVSIVDQATSSGSTARRRAAITAPLPPHRRLAKRHTRTIPSTSKATIGVMSPASVRPSSRQLSAVGIHQVKR